ncbi:MULTISPECIES: class I SAM-dependent methyltransferase [Pseudomonas]|nr:class I SAM-dependent methyltransferase [Pseudomonas fluorescens]
MFKAKCLGRLSGQDEGNPLSDGKGFDCAMYQHSLHHFPSAEIQQESLARISELLNDGGVLTITEHNSVLGGHELDLMHMVLQVYVELHQNPDISSSELEAVFNEFVEKETPANFSPKQDLSIWRKKSG